jgi:hypothetical protein
MNYLVTKLQAGIYKIELLPANNEELQALKALSNDDLHFQFIEAVRRKLGPDANLVEADPIDNHPFAVIGKVKISKGL